MATRPEKIYLIVIDGVPTHAYEQKEDAEGFLWRNPKSGAKVVPIWLTARATWKVTGN